MKRLILGISIWQTSLLCFLTVGALAWIIPVANSANRSHGHPERMIYPKLIYFQPDVHLPFWERVGFSCGVAFLSGLVSMLALVLLRAILPGGEKFITWSWGRTSENDKTQSPSN
ncbi:hypothetical protein [Gimesia sp.]|uniref:hypothetical protein n=1 Tax=Gimesia sp. TaxID=2024833 RepID=UPI003A94D3A9